MAGERGRSSATGTTGAGKAPGSDRSPALAANWDDRVAEAREKRARIIAQREASGEKKKPVRARPAPTGEGILPVTEPAQKKTAPPEPAAVRPAAKEPVARSAPAAVAPEILTARVPGDIARKARTSAPEQETVAPPAEPARAGAGPEPDTEIPEFRHPADDQTFRRSTEGASGRVRGNLPPLAAQVPPADPGTRLRAFSRWLETSTPGVRFAVIAFACCFGLGFGMVLSFGILAAMGWITPSQQSAGPARSTAVVSDAQPDVLTRTAVTMLAPTPGPGVGGLTTPGIAQQDTSRTGVPPLAGAAPADAYPAGFLSPGPLIGTYTPLLAGPEPASARPDPMALSGDKLAYVARTPARPGIVLSLSDQLPELAERNKVALWTELATLRVPSVQPREFAAPDAVVATTVFMPSPVLQGAAPGTAPVLNAALRILPAAVTAGIPATLPAMPAPADPATGPADIGTAPHIPAIVTPALYSPDTAEDLPQTGAPVERTLTLAGRLGLDVPERSRFSLVTFAPDSVSDSSVEESLARLSETGFPLGALNRVSFRVSKTHVRYYHPDDAEVARAIATEFGGPARDFTNISGTAPIGRVELWMTGDSGRTAAPVQRPRQATTKRAQPAPSAAELRAAAEQRLRNRLINSLRKEEYK
ncbi:hypothetical protein [Roseobacter ponti]|uniref:Uncharacterized protein n=1 Tax=Roseobacter ponti TaxID=1891787 RepID=A0A858SUF2_9RHOB|nr:hypothetical protein [Roseobacter ponti]QJF51141.1 hypothetical protein G3256_08205 [Roseobacter ponti]